jgi:hypothetical protein
VQSRTLPKRFTARFGTNFSNRLPADSVAANRHNEAPANGNGEHPAGGNPMAVWVGLAVAFGLLLLAYRNSSHLQQKVGPITPFELIVTFLMVVLAVTLGKAILTRFPIPGLTPLVQAL